MSLPATKLLQRVWTVSGFACGKYLVVSMGLWLDALEHHGELVAGKGRYSAQVRAEFEQMRKDANLRLQEQQQQQEAERQQMMEDMQRMQQALLAEREKAEAELKDELAASTNAQLASLTDADSARQAGMAATTSAEMEAIQAQIEEEKMRREQEKEAERQRLVEFQQQMKADIDAGATSHPPGHGLNSPRLIAWLGHFSLSRENR